MLIVQWLCAWLSVCHFKIVMLWYDLCLRLTSVVSVLVPASDSHRPEGAWVDIEGIRCFSEAGLCKIVAFWHRSLGLASCCMLCLRPKCKPLSGWSVLHSSPRTSLLWLSSPCPHSCHSCWYPSLATPFSPLLIPPFSIRRSLSHHLPLFLLLLPLTLALLL